MKKPETETISAGCRAVGTLMAVLFLSTSCQVQPPHSSMGFKEYSNVEQARDVFRQQQGWKIVRLTGQAGTRCVGVKPVAGTAWPDIGSREWVRVAGNRQTKPLEIEGVGGFYMVAGKNVLPVFGFYGPHSYRFPATVQVGNRHIMDIDDQTTVLSLEGKTVRFSLLTSPSKERTGAVETTGEVSLAGVGEAYRQLQTCLE